MTSAELTFKNGFCPHLSDTHLRVLLEACERDDPRFTQGSTTTPPSLVCVQDWPVEAACALGFCGWQGDNLPNVGKVEEFFADACFSADATLGEPAACRWFLNWFDDTPRDEMRTTLAEWCRDVLATRMTAVAPAPDFPN